MTALAIETAAEGGTVAETGFAITANGAYAARLARTAAAPGSRSAGRWTAPSRTRCRCPATSRRNPTPRCCRWRTAGCSSTAAWPAGTPSPCSTRPGPAPASCRSARSMPARTGSAAAAVPGRQLRLRPRGRPGTTTALWLVAGGAFGPERWPDVTGRCSGGVWLDRTGRMLALDRELDGRTKAVAVDLERGGEVTALLADRRGQRRPAAARRRRQRTAPDPLGRAGRRTARLGRAGLRAAGALPRVPAPGGRGRHAVRHPAGPGADAGVAARWPCASTRRRGSWLGIWRPAGRRLHQLAAPRGGWRAPDCGQRGVPTARRLRAACTDGGTPVRDVDRAWTGRPAGTRRRPLPRAAGVASSRARRAQTPVAPLGRAGTHA